MIRLHTIGVRVYYEDTDAGGIVYYANYLRFFERARTDWLRAAGISQQALAQVEGLNLVVRDCAVQYLRPARLDDLLQVEVSLANPATDVGRASLRITQRALLVQESPDEVVAAAGGAPAGNATGAAASGAKPAASVERVLATGTVRVACMDRRTGRPAPLPSRILQLLAEQVASLQAASVGVGASPAPGAQDSEQGSLQVSRSLPQQVFTRVTPDGTAEQQ